MRRFVVAAACCGIAAVAEPSYLLSSNAVCPTGASLIRTLAECRAAAALLRLQDTEPVEETRPAFPSGCFKGQGSQLFFNAGGVEGSLVGDARAVCAWAAASTTTPAPEPEDEQLGYRGSCVPTATDLDHVMIPVRSSPPAGPARPPPASFDARAEWPYCFEGSVRAQGGCGSCWAFAASAVVRQRACIYDCRHNQRCDTQNALHRRHLSVQHIMGCGPSRAGCDGGHAFQAYRAMTDGLAWEGDVPYRCGGGRIEDQFGTAAKGKCVAWPWKTVPEACHFGLGEHISVTGYHRLGVEGASSAADMMAAELATNGPLAVDFCVRDNFFAFWNADGLRVYTDADGCKFGRIVGGHMAMLVGFGSRLQGGRDVRYWTLENSWSQTWADAGYFYMERGVNLCGLENKASAPNVTVSMEVPPPNSSTTTTTTTILPTPPRTTAAVAPPPITLVGAESEDPGTMQVSDTLFHFLIVIASLGVLCCCLACAMLGFTVWKRGPPWKKPDYEMPLTCRETPGRAEPARPPPPLPMGVCMPGSAAAGAPARWPEVVGKPQERAAPPAGAGDPWWQKQDYVPSSVPATRRGSGYNPFDDAPPGAAPAAQRPAAPPPAQAGGAAASSRGTAGSSAAAPRASSAPPAGASGAAGEQQAVPPWWHKEVETYVDNADARISEEKRKSMY